MFHLPHPILKSIAEEQAQALVLTEQDLEKAEFPGCLRILHQSSGSNKEGMRPWDLKWEYLGKWTEKLDSSDPTEPEEVVHIPVGMSSVPSLKTMQKPQMK